MMSSGDGIFNKHGTQWSRAEHVVAFNLYCKLPFGQLHHSNSTIIELARILGRTPDSVAMKLCNFASLDPFLQQRGITGLKSASKGVMEVWDEFKHHPEQLAFESENLLATLRGVSLESIAGVEEHDFPPSGTERDALVRIRVNQGFFRKRILSAYNYRCCVTSLDTISLLVASHIVPWSQDTTNRLNPRNGLCLNALHDKAFDQGLMWVDEEFVIRFSQGLREKTVSTAPWLTSFEGKRLLLPRNFTPDPDLIRRHRESRSQATL